MAVARGANAGAAPFAQRQSRHPHADHADRGHFRSARIDTGHAVGENESLFRGLWSERPASRCRSTFSEIAAALAELRKWSPLARMTGSGACVFAPFASERGARAAFDARPPGMHGFVARTLARHPLAAFA